MRDATAGINAEPATTHGCFAIVPWRHHPAMRVPDAGAMTCSAPTQPCLARVEAPSPGPLVVALHCSGGTGRQWRWLAQSLHGTAPVLAPDLLGTVQAGPWAGDGPFGLADEAAPILAAIDASSAPIHLVGHSYGGGLALHVVAARPSRIASLSLYEPSAFHLLAAATDPDGRAAYGEIREVARAVEDGLVSGAYRRAAERFVDYWNGDGAWAGLKRSVQDDLVRYVPKVCLDFRALFGGSVTLDAYRSWRVPTLILQGEHAPRPTALIARKLRAAAPDHALRVVVPGAGHMGPLTHGEAVAGFVANHVRSAMASSAVRIAA